MNELTTQTLNSMPNYEAMYKDLEKSFCLLQKKKDDLYNAVGGLERENEKLRAQLEIVHLIFGGDNR